MKEVTNSKNRTASAKQQTTGSAQGTNTSAAQNSTQNKSVENRDTRKRQDGPGGN